MNLAPQWQKHPRLTSATFKYGSSASPLKVPVPQAFATNLDDCLPLEATASRACPTPRAPLAVARAVANVVVRPPAARACLQGDASYCKRERRHLGARVVTRELAQTSHPPNAAEISPSTREHILIARSAWSRRLATGSTQGSDSDPVPGFRSVVGSLYQAPFPEKSSESSRRQQRGP